MTLLLRHLAVTLTLMFVWTLRAQNVVEPGDLMIAGTCTDYFGLNTCGAYVEVRHPDGSPKSFLPLQSSFLPGSVLEIIYDPDGTVHTVHTNEIRTFPASFQNPSIKYLFGMDDGVPVALTMNQERTLFALFRRGLVVPFPKSGEMLPSIQIPLARGRLIFNGDLGLDQCTLYYVEASQTAGSSIRRFDICSNTALPGTILDLPGCAASQVRVARDGSVFISACSTVYRIDAAGTIRTYALSDTSDPRHLAIVLAPDGRTFWAKSGEILIEIDIATGSTIRGPLRSGGSFLAIYGTPRAAALANATSIPTVSYLMLAMIAIGATTIAWLRLG